MSKTCLQAGSSILITPLGLRTLEEVSVGDVIWSGYQWATITQKDLVGNKECDRLYTSVGQFDGIDSYVISKGKRQLISNADSIDICSLPNIELDPTLFCPIDIMDGLVIGDGTVYKKTDCCLIVGEKDYDYFKFFTNGVLARKPFTKSIYGVTTTIIPEELPTTYLRTIPDRFKYGNAYKVGAFLKGLFTANGCVTDNSISLKMTSFDLINSVQLMLHSIGIRGTISVKKEKIGFFPNGTYTCRQAYDLIIRADKIKYAERIGFIQKYKENKYWSLTTKDRMQLTYEFKYSDPLGEVPIYQLLTSNPEATYCSNGLLVSCKGH